MTHYEILGIRKTATSEEIKSAYKKLIKKYHPDVYLGDKTFAEKKSQEINVAYDVLSDPDKKREYDETINPNASTSYTPPDFSNYTYTPSYKSKRQSQAQGSQYSYENYKKNYKTTDNYEFNKRYTDYHRSKTPNSNYDANNQQSHINKENIYQLTNSSKFFIVFIILIAYIIFFIVTMMQFFNLISIKDTPSYNNSITEDYNSNYDFDINSSIYDTQNQTYEEYYNKKSNTTSENIITKDNFDINAIYTDAELREIYHQYYSTTFPSFKDFKKAISDSFYEIFYQNN